MGEKQIGTVRELVKDADGQIIGIVIARMKSVPGNVPGEVLEMRAIATNDVQWHSRLDQSVTGELRDPSVLDDANIGRPH